MSYKALVLSSGGLDSTTCLSVALDRFGFENVSTVTVFYGQKHSREIECARKIAEYYSVKHYELDLSNVFKYSDCALLESSDKEIPEISYAEQLEQTGKVSTLVPFRNGLMLSAVASLAQSIYPDDFVYIYLGNHADDAAGNAYPDCSLEFTEAMNQAIGFGTAGKVQLESPFVNVNKSQVVAKGLELKTPYELTYSCYEGREKSCGRCATCLDRLAAFEANDAKDPIEYEVDIDWSNCKSYHR